MFGYELKLNKFIVIRGEQVKEFPLKFSLSKAQSILLHTVSNDLFGGKYTILRNRVGKNRWKFELLNHVLKTKKILTIQYHSAHDTFQKYEGYNTYMWNLDKIKHFKKNISDIVFDELGLEKGFRLFKPKTGTVNEMSLCSGTIFIDFNKDTMSHKPMHSDTMKHGYVFISKNIPVSVTNEELVKAKDIVSDEYDSRLSLLEESRKNALQFIDNYLIK